MYVTLIYSDTCFLNSVMYLATRSLTYILHYAQVYYYDRGKKMGCIQNFATKNPCCCFPEITVIHRGPKSSELSGASCATHAHTLSQSSPLK